MQVMFSVPFVQGQARPRFGQGRAYDPASNARAKRAIRAAFNASATAQHYVPAPAHTPVCVDITTTRPLPASRPKKIASEPDTFKPDIDNIAKLVLDALTKHAYADDAQVVKLNVTKVPRTRDMPEATTIVVYY